VTSTLLPRPKPLTPKQRALLQSLDGWDDLDTTPDTDTVLTAVWSLTRQAKRYRDRAQYHYQRGKHGWAGKSKKKKEECYRLKAQALAHLIADGVLTTGHGVHRFPGDVYAEVVRGRGYTFHRPCAPCDEGVTALHGVEARPRAKKELSLRDAVGALEWFLRTRPTVEVYQWTDRSRPRVRSYGGCWECGSPDHLARDCDGSGDDECDDYDPREDWDDE
jgi:hypothetical protein